MTAKLFIKKNKQYFPAFLFLFTVIFLAWYFFICRKVVDDIALQITGILSVLGLGFALFQFLFNHIATEKRRTFDLRYNAYKEIVSIIESIPESLNGQMTPNQILSIDNLVSNLMNQVNRFSSAMKEHDVFLFMNIKNLPESLKMKEIVEKILERTNVCKQGIEEASRQFDNSSKANFAGLVTMTWHNEMRDYLKELHEHKYKFYSKLREYFN